MFLNIHYYIHFEINGLSLENIEKVTLARTCCPSNYEKNRYVLCRLVGRGRQFCISETECQESDTCPPGWEDLGDIVNEYCKLGCETSVCGAMNTLKNSDANEIVKGALEQCAKACTTFCTKSSKATLETA
ncbi:PREDICTED: thionin-2.1-like [Camelina sativa]|uniref:Thionin-2.1-like n=1 Tax=Camelina sativa TaxID=90675 RepID=A0ABM0TU64_CAMSA|nr:PREDICTED: thionin-2.1-like [Camelina sativa]